MTGLLSDQHTGNTSATGLGTVASITAGQLIPLNVSLDTSNAGAVTETITFAGQQSNSSSFSAALPDQVLTITGTVTAAPCFAAGTRIMTEQGEVPVEELHIGDRLKTVVGPKFQPVTWIGMRVVSCQHHPEPAKVWPVRISAGAFGRGLPRRDLWLSPDHAVYLDGSLIPVKHLINGSTIVQVQVASVSYYHVQLPRHDVLLAEGLAAESYLDTGDRSNFSNGGPKIALHPDFGSRLWEAEGCAPLVVTGPELAAARRHVKSATRGRSRKIKAARSGG
jgi:hypothetical protein